MATAPNQLWSWDITKLRGPEKWSYYYLYVILDVFSRAVVGWLIAEREDALLAEALIAETCAKQGIEPQQLTIHADRGSAMTSKVVAQLLSDLGVAKTHSRPHVSNDNPFSEAHFKTMKYRPSYPDRFGSLIDARVWAREFFAWYNHEHRHSGIGLLTPAMVHCGQAAEQVAVRGQVLEAAYTAHPERFVRGCPRPPAVPSAVWINPPERGEEPPERCSTTGATTGPMGWQVRPCQGSQPRTGPLTRPCQPTILDQETCLWAVTPALPKYGRNLSHRYLTHSECPRTACLGGAPTSAPSSVTNDGGGAGGVDRHRLGPPNAV